MGKLDEKVSIITGGASGIGEATVRLFAKEGASIIIADRQEDLGNKLAQELGSNVSFILTDVKEESNVKATIKYASTEFGRLDCLFNNAGLERPDGPIDTIKAKSFDLMMDVMVRGTFFGMKHAARMMKKQGFGSIINNASVAGLVTGYGSHLYNAAKAAIIQLTRSVAMELGELGIRVNCICPGFIATPMFGRFFGLSQQDSEKKINDVKNVIKDYQPIKRPGMPEDIAKAALWLASDDSSFVNGHALVVDGGLICGKMWSEQMNLATNFTSLMMKNT